LNDGSGIYGPYAAYINPDSEGLCPGDDYLYFFQRLEVNGGIDAFNLYGACSSASYFSDLTRVVHRFAIDSGGLYIARSDGDTIEVYRIDRSTNDIVCIYDEEFLDQRRALLIDVSNGHVLLHSYDRDNLSDYEVLLLNTQNTSDIYDDITLLFNNLPGSGIPMHFQLLVAP